MNIWDICLWVWDEFFVQMYLYWIGLGVGIFLGWNWWDRQKQTKQRLNISRDRLKPIFEPPKDSRKEWWGKEWDEEKEGWK